MTKVEFVLVVYGLVYRVADLVNLRILPLCRLRVLGMQRLVRYDLEGRDLSSWYGGVAALYFALISTREAVVEC